MSHLITETLIGIRKGPGQFVRLVRILQMLNRISYDKQQKTDYEE